jgi:hypothetical protein
MTATIEADGRTDDLPGLIAAFENQPVKFGGKTYAPGEDLILRSKHLAISWTIRLIKSTGDEEVIGFDTDHAIDAHSQRNGRRVVIANCDFYVTKRRPK